MGIFTHRSSKLHSLTEAEIDGKKTDDEEEEDYTAGADNDDDDNPAPDDTGTDDNNSDDDVDYTEGADDEGDDDDTGNDEGSDDDDVDYTDGADDEGGEDENSDDIDYTDGADDDGGDDEDEGDGSDSDGEVDYTDGADGGAEGDGEGDDSSGDDIGEEGSDEDSNEDEGDSMFEDLQKIESELFSNLSPEQVEIKNQELKQRFIDIYTTIASVLIRINDVPKTDTNVDVLHFVTDKLIELRDLVDYNITKSFATKTYIENSINYQLCLSTLNSISDIIDSVSEPEKDEDRKGLDNEDDDGVIVGGTSVETDTSDDNVAVGNEVIESSNYYI